MPNEVYQEDIERIRAMTDIVQVIGSRINLDKNNRAICPFHSDHNPSFSVHAKGQFFKCFGCGLGGDVFKFVMLMERREFKEVLYDFARKAGIPAPDYSATEIREIEKARQAEDILQETARYYHSRLNFRAKNYLLLERGFKEETITKFQIGCADGGLKDHLLKDGKFPIEACVDAGILKKGKDGIIRDYFYKRIIFPNSCRGRIVHLTGRSIDGSEPKYLHLPGPILHFYNEDSLFNEEVLITEGVTDCISAIQAGYEAIGIYGVMNFKAEHIDKFKRCEKIYICLDADEAGRSGALRVAELLGEKARITMLPDGYDINDFFKEFTEKGEFERIKEKAENLIRYKLNRIPPEIGKVELAEKLKPVVTDLAKADPATAEAYLSNDIRVRFHLKKNEIDAYRKLMRHLPEDAKAGRKRSQGYNEKIKYTASFDGLVDLVSYHGEPAFLIRTGDGIEIQSEAEIDGDVFVPPPKGQIPWLLPRGEKVLEFWDMERQLALEEGDSALYDDLRDYHERISELPSGEYYDLITAWVFHTYLAEQVQYTPIICLFAVPERGKTRTGKGIINVAYRGIHVESLRDPYIVRVANDLQASLFFDVKDIWRKAEKNGSEDILLLRFEKGGKVPRVLYPERGAHRDMVYYQIFGPTIIGTNEAAHRILETRAVQINMPETSRQFDNDVTPELALPLKERLLCFRARHLGFSLPDMSKPATGRLGDILKPIFQVVKLAKPEREPALVNLVRQLEGERLLEKSESIEALILGAILTLESKVERGLLPQKEILSDLNQDRPENHKFTPQIVGRRLSALGIKKTRTSNGASAIFWNAGQFRQLAEKYGLSESSVSSVSSVSQGVPAEETELTEETEVIYKP